MPITIIACLLWAPQAGFANGAEQKAFPTPNAAVAALVAAVKARSADQLTAILGSELAEFTASRDKSQNEVDRLLFLEASRKVKLEKEGKDPNTMIAYLGEVEWPFPAPLLKTAAGWKFDGKAAIEEIQDRQIGRNELGALASCQAYVDVQLEYFAVDHLGDGYLQFAQRVNSTPGKFDGLYWSNANGEDVSPIGPFAAQAAALETRSSGDSAPLFGYYFKILTSQGDAAVGGARNYIVDGRMIGGFALVAWPAEYNVSGVSTFIVNHLGTVYQKDLGPDSARIAEGMEQFNPDSSWKRIDE